MSTDPTESPASDTPGESAAAPSKFKIGSQRPGSPRVQAVAKTVLAESAPPHQKVAVPNRRAGLAEDLEAEVAAALEGFSLNEIAAPVAAVKPKETADGEPDNRRTGRVIKVHNQDVFIDLGGRDQGILSLTQFKEPPQAGQVVNVIVNRVDPDDGLLQLSLPGSAIEAGDWSSVTEGSLVDVKISGTNKGGLECAVGNLRGFIPAGQVSLYRIENFDEFVGQHMVCYVTEVNAERKRLVLSRRAVLEREKAEAKEKMMAELAVGDVREGTVRSLMDFGAFVDLGGVDGLIHISRLAWQRVKHPGEVLTVGQPVKVKIVNIDTATGKIGLSLRDLAGDPWIGASIKYKQGDVIRGPVVRILDKVGAFVQLEPGIDGLVHISEIAHSRVFRVTDFVQEGQEVEAKILSVDLDQKRISLSMKALAARPEPVKKEPEIPEEPDVPAAPLPPQPKNLKGGLKRKRGGEQFGLKW